MADTKSGSKGTVGEKNQVTQEKMEKVMACADRINAMPIHPAYKTHLLCGLTRRIIGD